MTRKGMPLVGLGLILAACGGDDDGTPMPGGECDPQPTDANYVFVTSTLTAPGDLGVEVADALCNEHARDAGLPGRYVAWLSATGNDARDRIGTARGWVRLDGLPFADTLEDLAMGRVYYPVLYDESCRATESEVWTGTDVHGMASETCNEWAGDGMGKWGDARGTTEAWTWSSTSPCRERKAVLCFGVDHTTPVMPTPVNGRRAFISTGWMVGGGLEGADARCADDAEAAGLSGTFRALIATSTASAASRFDASGANWVRLDGVPPAASPDDLFAARFVSTITQRADGMYELPGYERAWVGAIDPTSIGDETCSDWTDAEARGRNTDVLTAGKEAFEGSAGDCSFAHGLYCLEE